MPSCHLWLNSDQVEVACFLLALPLEPCVLQQLQGVKSGRACSLFSADVDNGPASPAVAAVFLQQAGQPELSLSAWVDHSAVSLSSPNSMGDGKRRAYPGNWS